MIPLSPKDIQSGALHARAINLLTGEIQDLITRDRSDFCLFFEPFKSGGYSVWLRLDWKDQDSHGNPTLDADFHYPDTDKIDKSMKKHPAHHTTAEGTGSRIYAWEFADEVRKIRIELEWSVFINESVHLDDRIEVEKENPGQETP